MNVTKFGSWSTRALRDGGRRVDRTQGPDRRQRQRQEDTGYPVAVKRIRFRCQDCTGAVLRQFGMTKTFSYKFIEVLGQGQTLGVVHDEPEGSPGCRRLRQQVGEAPGDRGGGLSTA